MRRASTITCGAGAVAAAAIAVLRFAGDWVLIPFLGLAIIGAVLARIDLLTHCLPNRIVLPGVGASTLLLTGAAALDGDIGRGLTALLGGAALFAFYLVLALISPNGMGMGDVKLAALVGLFAGYLGLTAWVLAAFAGFFIGGVVALAGMLLRRRGRRDAIPFGPWMLVGLWIAVALTSSSVSLVPSQ